MAQYRDRAGTQVVAQKLRTPDKKFAWVGSRAEAEPLYGMHLWKGGGKMVVVTEGEIDAMSVSQLQQHKWPVVSLPDGCAAATKALGQAIEWLDTFEKVVLMFDMDKPGRDAIEAASDVLPCGKAFIAELPLKDANECLKENKGDAVISAIWNARPYRPDAVLDGDAVWQKMENYEGPTGVETPWPLLKPFLPLLPVKRILTILAGTGSGKTTFVKRLEAELSAANERVGIFHFEEDVVETALGVMSAASRKQEAEILKMSKAVRQDLYRSTAGKDGMFYYDSFGSLDPDVVMRKIRFLVKTENIKYVVIDHLSIMLSGLEISNERKAIDVVMTRFRQLVEELKIGLILISHLTKGDSSKSHEEGDPVRLRDARGSQSIAQISDIVLALERNQQAEDLAERNLIRVRILKNRVFRKLGVACKLFYDDKDGSLTDFPADYLEKPKDEFEAVPDSEYSGREGPSDAASGGTTSDGHISGTHDAEERPPF